MENPQSLNIHSQTFSTMLLVFERERERERRTQQIDCLNKKVVYAFRDGREKVVLVDSDRVAFVINFSMMDERPEIQDKDKDIEPVRVIRQDKIKSKYKLSISLQ